MTVVETAYLDICLKPDFLSNLSNRLRKLVIVRVQLVSQLMSEFSDLSHQLCNFLLRLFPQVFYGTFSIDD